MFISQSRSFGRYSGEAKVWLYTLGSLVPLSWLMVHGFLSLLSFLMVCTALIILTVGNKSIAICVTLAYLFLLGDIRRIIGTFIGFPKLDPLLLVGPVITLIFAIPLLMRLRLKDGVSKVMFALLVVMLLQVVNPRQGPIIVGISGAMFYVIPILWFWIGRRYGTEKVLFAVIYRVVIPLAVTAGILGLCQTYVGFLPWEAVWIAAVKDHYHALNLGGGYIRAFGFSVNSVEYAGLELVGATSVLAAFFSGRRFYAFFFPILAAALFLASSRTSIVKLIFSVAVAWALSSKGGKGWAVRLPAAIAVLFGILAFSLSRVSSSSPATPGTAAGFSAEHQVQGLAHPLDSKKSTAGLHVTYFLGGFKQGFTSPVGFGLGAITLGGGKFGDSGSGDDDSAVPSEIDISDSFVSLGLIGGLLYVSAIFLIIRRAISFGQSAPKSLGLPAIAILASMGGAWIALGQYGMGPLLWFIIGCLVRDTDQTSPKAVTIAGRATKVHPHPDRYTGRTPARGTTS